MFLEEHRRTGQCGRFADHDLFNRSWSDPPLVMIRLPMAS